MVIRAVPAETPVILSAVPLSEAVAIARAAGLAEILYGAIPPVTVVDRTSPTNKVILEPDVTDSDAGKGVATTIVKLLDVTVPNGVVTFTLIESPFTQFA
jgi:hypothetical protein